ncbi:hypothetical protein ACFQ36_20580 [Arthrobacter sp. GCM10027362]|uniref:hypothetical protein n=1 Tax=Arthrobacter sp. GCM10027362 TaxID=3273379 RepID=UPI0036301F97
MSLESSVVEGFVADTATPGFLQNYYGHLAPEDTAEYRPEDLEARVGAHLSVGYARRQREAIISVGTHGGCLGHLRGH